MPQRLSSICGFGLIRILYDRGYIPGEIVNEGTRVEGYRATEWQYRFLCLEGAGTLMWYTDESQLYPDSFGAVTSQATTTGQTLASHEQVLRMDAEVGADSRSITLEIAVQPREVQLWQTVLAYHMDEASEFGVRGATASFAGNKAEDHTATSDPDLACLTNENMDAVISIFLKEKQHTLSLNMSGDAALLSKEFVQQQELRDDFAVQIELELLRAQLELYRAREGQFHKQFSKVQRKVHGIVIAEAHASMAESLAAELTDAMTKVRNQIVPDLQTKVHSLEVRCAAAEKAMDEAQTQQAFSENKYIAENVRLQQQLQAALRRPGASKSPSPNKGMHVNPSTPAPTMNADTNSSSGGVGTGNSFKGGSNSGGADPSNIDALLGNINLSSPIFLSSSAADTTVGSASNNNQGTRSGSGSGFSSGIHSHLAETVSPYGQDKVYAEVLELRRVKVALGKQLQTALDEINVTKYELAQAYSRKAEQRKMLNFTDIVDEPVALNTNELRIQLHKQRERIESLVGAKHTLEKEREALQIRVGELEGKNTALSARCVSLSEDKHTAEEQLQTLQESYDSKTISVLQAENRHLREETIKFRGEGVKLRARIDDITQNAASALQYPNSGSGAMNSTQNISKLLSATPVASSEAYSDAKRHESQKDKERPTMDFSGTNMGSGSDYSSKEIHRLAAAPVNATTPRSALLGVYPMPGGGSSRDASASAGGSLEAKPEAPFSSLSSGSSMSGLFGAVEGGGGEQSERFPFSKSHAQNPNKAISDALSSARNDAGVKWHPPEHDALSQRLSPVVEDRLLRVVYHRYIHEHKGPSARDIMLANLPSATNGSSSAAFAHAASSAVNSGANAVQNTAMTLGRFIRFAKEFHLCFVGSSSAITCTPPYLVSGEMDVIFANAAKVKISGDESSVEKYRPYGARAGAGSDKQYLRGNMIKQTTGLTLTVGQFVEAVKSIACKLYANVIELQTGTTLDCLPPRQRSAAARAVFDVLIKKKILPVAEKLELMPWPLVYVEQTVNIFGEFRVAQQCLSSHFSQIVLWFDYYKTQYAPPSSTFSATGLKLQDLEVGGGWAANGVKVGLTYKAMSQFAHDFGIVPYLLKEPQLYGLFQEFMLWSSNRPEELHKSLPPDITRRALQREKGIEEEEPEDFMHFGKNEAHIPFGMSPQVRALDRSSPRSPIKSPSKSASPSVISPFSTSESAVVTSNLTPRDANGFLPLSCGLASQSTSNCRLGLISFCVFFGSMAQHAFPDQAPEHRLLKLFEVCAQSGGEYIIAGRK